MTYNAGDPTGSECQGTREGEAARTMGVGSSPIEKSITENRDDEV